MDGESNGPGEAEAVSEVTELIEQRIDRSTLSEEVAAKAVFLVEQYDTKTMEQRGAKYIAGGATHAACLIVNEQRTQGEIASLFDCSPKSIRKYQRDIARTVSRFQRK